MATGGGGQSLGGAQFTITANTAQFQQGLQQAQQQAQGATHVIVDNFRGIQYQLSAINQTAMTTTAAVQALTTQLSTMAIASARGGGGFQQTGSSAKYAALGFLYLSQAIEDAQYGFSAIVNNIPLIVMAMGGSAGLAGAISIVAVGINQVVQHWEGFKATLGDTAPFQAVLGFLAEGKKSLEDFDAKAEGTGNAWSGLLRLFSGGALGANFRESEIGARMGTDKAAREAETDKLIETFEKDKGGDKEEAARFQEAIGQYGGTGKLYKEILRGRVADMGGMVDAATGKITFGGREDQVRSDWVKRQAAEQVQRGMQGRLQPTEQFPKGFADTLEVIKHEKEVKGIQEAQAESKRVKEKRDKETDDLNKKGEENAQKMKLDMLHDQKEDLEKQFAREKHALTGPARQQLEDRIIGSKAPQEAKLMSTKAFVDATMTSGASQMPQKQLDKLTAMHKTLESINKEIKTVGRLQ